jgi:O-acetylserine/cysteine efflux transporter
LQPRHIALATVLALFWGFNFVVVTVALGDVPPLFLAAVRFALVALPVVFLPRPALPLGQLVAVSMTLFVGQFAFLFPAMAVGMPPGLASIALQIQAFITILFAALVIGELPTRKQTAGGVVAFLGLALVATTVGANGVTLAGFVLLLGAACCWSAGNVVLRRTGNVDLLALVSWASLIAVGPLLLLSLLVEGPARIAEGVAHLDWLAAGAILYIAFVSTTFGYGAWGYLLRIYPAAIAAPFSLLVPVFGIASAWLFLSEAPSPTELLGAGVVMIGLAFTVGLTMPRRRGEAEPCASHVALPAPQPSSP